MFLRLSSSIQLTFDLLFWTSFDIVQILIETCMKDVYLQHLIVNILLLRNYYIKCVNSLNLNHNQR